MSDLFRNMSDIFFSCSHVFENSLSGILTILVFACKFHRFHRSFSYYRLNENQHTYRKTNIATVKAESTLRQRHKNMHCNRAR